MTSEEPSSPNSISPIIPGNLRLLELVLFTRPKHSMKKISQLCPPNVPHGVYIYIYSTYMEYVFNGRVYMPHARKTHTDKVVISPVHALECVDSHAITCLYRNVYMYINTETLSPLAATHFDKPRRLLVLSHKPCLRACSTFSGYPDSCSKCSCCICICTRIYTPVRGR